MLTNNENLTKNAIAFLQGRFPSATVVSNESQLAIDRPDQVVLNFALLIVQDPSSGIKQRALAIADLGQQQHLSFLATNLETAFDPVDKGIQVGFGNANPKGHWINTTQMAFAPRTILYTNEMKGSYQAVMDIFEAAGQLVDIVDECELFSTLFISYGGPDEENAGRINKFLRGKGIKTWFFPDNALPGQKLHRMMHDGVNNHDRVLLICSAQSLSRPGVLNEIEKVLEREAREGGSEILIPITLDGFVYQDWAPTRPDLAQQVRSRVIGKIELTDPSQDEVNAQLVKLANALSRRHG